jgi:hypothetical protein
LRRRILLERGDVVPYAGLAIKELIESGHEEHARRARGGEHDR